MTTNIESKATDGAAPTIARSVDGYCNFDELHLYRHGDQTPYFDEPATSLIAQMWRMAWSSPSQN